MAIPSIRIAFAMPRRDAKKPMTSAAIGWMPKLTMMIGAQQPPAHFGRRHHLQQAVDGGHDGGHR